jgi:hypothetical protein
LPCWWGTRVGGWVRAWVFFPFASLQVCRFPRFREFEFFVRWFLLISCALCDFSFEVLNYRSLPAVPCVI